MKILIIEDEYNLADAVASMLKSNKYSVEIRTDGQEGLEEALTDIYDLIILDVMLPHMNGFEILKELRNEKINSKILMLTAKNTIDDKMIGFNNGADDYLTKPFHMEELMARVNVQLRKKNNKKTIDKQFEYNTYIRDFFNDNKGMTLEDAIKCWKYKKNLKGYNKYEKDDLKVLKQV